MKKKDKRGWSDSGMPPAQSNRPGKVLKWDEQVGGVKMDCGGEAYGTGYQEVHMRGIQCQGKVALSWEAPLYLC